MSELSVVRFWFKELIGLLIYEAFATFFSYEALASPFLKDLSFHFLGDGEGLVDEGVGEDVGLGFGQDEAEVVLAVAAEGEGAHCILIT